MDGDGVARWGCASKREGGRGDGRAANMPGSLIIATKGKETCFEEEGMVRNGDTRKKKGCLKGREGGLVNVQREKG